MKRDAQEKNAGKTADIDEWHPKIIPISWLVSQSKCLNFHEFFSIFLTHLTSVDQTYLADN